LVRRIKPLGTFTVCEGGIGSPEQAKAALRAGADALVVGTAITNLDRLVRLFVDATT
jgi:N-acylglucosamine-6-phosphate 2-epimerase